MNIQRLCSIGYFDRIVIDGYTVPLFNSKGIELVPDNNFIESLKIKSNYYHQFLARLRVNIYGDSIFNPKDDELLNMRFHRESKLGLSRIKVDNYDRYLIAYIDITILKKEFNNIHSGIEDEILLHAVSEDEKLLLNTALKIRNNTNNNVAIIDRIYVVYNFRNSGISSWVHSNIYDIIKIYSMLDIESIILIPGDFSREANLFGLNYKQYKDFLINHYKKYGYRFITKDIMQLEINKNNKSIVNLMRHVRSK